jgi:GT2 family glycosyltransferase
VEFSDVTVVVVTWQQRELALRALASVAAQTVPCRVLVVDNGSTDGTSEAVAESAPDVELLRLPVNVGFAGGVDAAMTRVRTRFVALLNNDAVADVGWLAASLDALGDPGVAAATSKLVLDDGTATINNAGVVLLTTGYGADRGLGMADDDEFAEPVEVFGFSGGAAVLRTMAVRAVGGFAAEWFMYYEDTDLSWRLRLAGWRIVYAPDAVVWHRHAASSDAASRFFAFQNERNRLLMLVRNAPIRTAVGAAARFALTTGSLAAKRLRGREVPAAPVFDPSLRLDVARDVVRRLPQTLRQRGRVPRVRSRGAVLTQWSGVAQRPLGPVG